jgi:predicted nucleic acid-binding protein
VNFLLDTNVISEWAKPRPDLRVLEWFSVVDEGSVYLSAITMTEIRLGIDRLPASRKKSALSNWLEMDMVQRFEGRIIPIDLAVADTAGRILAKKVRHGMSDDMADALLAATAQVYQLTLVTRNTRHFKKLNLMLFNPWIGA